MLGGELRETLLVKNRFRPHAPCRIAPKLFTAGDLYSYGLQEGGELRGGFDLRYRIEFLERRHEGVR